MDAERAEPRDIEDGSRNDLRVCRDRKEVRVQRFEARYKCFVKRFRLEDGDLQFLRTLPRLVTRHARADLVASLDRENRQIARLQSSGLLRCQIDAEHSGDGFFMAELSLTDAGRAVLAADT